MLIFNLNPGVSRLLPQLSYLKAPVLQLVFVGSLTSMVLHVCPVLEELKVSVTIIWFIYT